MAELRRLIAQNPSTHRPVDSIAELAPLLPREMRENFTFVYDSRSPYRASISPAFPRVVMFTADARLVVSFTGDPDKPGADILEAAEFDDGKSAFVFEALPLPAAQRREFRPSASDLDCGRCHGRDKRPIFDAYPLWPGFYGAVLDTFPDDARGARERKAFLAFRGHAARAAPYKDLIYPPGSAVSPYLDPARHRLRGVELEPSLLPLLPNTRLGMALTQLNFKRIGRKLAAAPGYAKFEKSALSELLRCGARGPSSAALLAVSQSVAAENARRLTRLGRGPAEKASDIDQMQELHFTQEIATIEDVAALMGADASDWSMALDPGSRAYFDGLLSGVVGGRSYYLEESLALEILQRLAARDSAFKRYLQVDWMLAESGYPFGDRLDIPKARGACALLR